jgi:hypothetical protein
VVNNLANTPILDARVQGFILEFFLFEQEKVPLAAGTLAKYLFDNLLELAAGS